jgi:hypothetical protein
MQMRDRSYPHQCLTGYHRFGNESVCRRLELQLEIYDDYVF